MICEIQYRKVVADLSVHQAYWGHAGYWGHAFTDEPTRGVVPCAVVPPREWRLDLLAGTWSSSRGSLCMASVSALPLRSGSSWSSSGATVYGARHTALEGQGQSDSLDANVDALRVKPIVAGEVPAATVSDRGMQKPQFSQSCWRSSRQ